MTILCWQAAWYEFGTQDISEAIEYPELVLKDVKELLAYVRD